MAKFERYPLDENVGDSIPPTVVNSKAWLGQFPACWSRRRGLPLSVPVAPRS